MADQRVELVREGTKMGLWLGELCLAKVEAGPAAQQLARYVEMQLRAGFSAESIQKMLRGESQQTTGSAAPARKTAPKQAAPDRKTPPKQAAPDLAKVLDGTVSAVKKKLATGAHDAHLAELVALETAGKGRKGVLEALAARGTP
jgi:hypothetical protein